MAAHKWVLLIEPHPDQWDLGRRLSAEAPWARRCKLLDVHGIGKPCTQVHHQQVVTATDTIYARRVLATSQTLHCHQHVHSQWRLLNLLALLEITGSGNLKKTRTAQAIGSAFQPQARYNGKTGWMS